MNGMPERPSIPPVAWLAVLMWVGAVVGEHLAWSGNLHAVVAVCVGSGALAVVAFAKRASFAVLACVGLLCGAALSGLEWCALQQRLADVRDSGAREWSGFVEADPTIGAYGPVVRVRLQGGPLDGARVRVGWPEGQQIPELGRQVRFSAVLKPLPLAEEWARRAARGGACASGAAWLGAVGRWRRGWSGPLYEWRASRLVQLHDVPGSGGGLAEGIVLGDRRRLSGTPTEQDFQVLGLSHLVAVSGSHLALACGAVAFLASVLRVPRRPLVILTFLAGLAYAVVTGMPYSALRSLMMLGVAGSGQLIGRRGDGISSLSVAVVCVLALEPWSAFDLGLQLSILAVAALLLYGGLATTWVAAGLPHVWRTIASPVALTLAAQVATIPLVASTFGMVSVMAPVANALVGALVSVALLLGLSGAVLGSVLPPASVLGFRAAACVLGATAELAEGMAGLPGAAVALGGGVWLALATAALAIIIWVRWPLPGSASASRRFSVVAIACSVALALGPAPPRKASVVVLDVGQGDAIMVRDGGRVMLVDTGADALALRQALARTGVRRVDVLVLTHAHDDHTGGNEGLAAVAEIGWVGVPVRPPSADRDAYEGFNLPDTGAVVRTLAAGERWALGDTDVTVLWPPGGETPELDTNDTSIVLAVRRGAFDMVLTGDAERAAQEGMASTGQLHDIDVLKVPHHGSTNGLTAESLGMWSPEAALISVGKGNDFGHPNVETLDLLRGADVRVFRTDELGDLFVEIGDNGYRIRTAHRGGSSSVRARMGTGAPSPNAPGAPFRQHASRGIRGSQDRGSQARVPHIRRRGVAAGSRAPPPSRPHIRRGRPGLQL